MCVDGLVQSPVVNERRFNMFHHKVNPSSPHIVFFILLPKLLAKNVIFSSSAKSEKFVQGECLLSSIAHVAVDVVVVKGRR